MQCYRIDIRIKGAAALLCLPFQLPASLCLRAMRTTPQHSPFNKCTDIYIQYLTSKPDVCCGLESFELPLWLCSFNQIKLRRRLSRPVNGCALIAAPRMRLRVLVARRRGKNPVGDVNNEHDNVHPCHRPTNPPLPTWLFTISLLIHP